LNAIGQQRDTALAELVVHAQRHHADEV
jgi:hypothetical protein